MIIVVMGVSGVGKTTIGGYLASQLGFRFAEGDDYHPAANIEKMSKGIPLDETDRRPWLNRLASDINRWIAEAENVVVTCSALRRRYREILSQDRTKVVFLYLKAPRSVVEQRIRQRTNHYMPASLLNSQIAALEEPVDESRVLTIDASVSKKAMLPQLLDWLEQRKR